MLENLYPCYFTPNCAATARSQAAASTKQPEVQQQLQHDQSVNACSKVVDHDASAFGQFFQADESEEASRYRTLEKV